MSTPTPEGTEPETVKFVPMRELTELARIGLEMRRAQRAYFDAKRERPNSDHSTAYRYARQCEQRFERVAKDALAQEQQTLPGMG